MKKVKKSTIPFAPSEWGKYVTQEQLENELELVTKQTEEKEDELIGLKENAMDHSCGDFEEDLKELKDTIAELKEKKEILEKALEGVK